MIELPEASILAKQVNETVTNKEIICVIAEQSPHKFAWYHKDPQQYGDILEGRSIQHATAVGGLSCYPKGEEETSSYYMVAKSKPSPLSKEFDEAYFEVISSAKEVQKLSVKAFLATEQRIPGLGNGVLQDILWTAKLHPKRKMNTLSGEERAVMYVATQL